MPRPSMRMLVALGAAAALTLTACGTTVDGVAAPDPAGLIDVNSPTIETPGDDDPTTESTETTSESSSEEPTTDEPTTDDPTTESTTEEPTTDEPTTDEPTTDDPTTDDPTSDDGDLGTTLPATWPAGIALPDGSTIGYSYSDDSGQGVFFDTSAAAADVMGFLEGELTANGWVLFGDYSDDTSLTKSYGNGDMSAMTEVATIAISDNGDGTSSTILVFTSM